MPDPLAVFFTQPVEVKRLTGDGAYGPIFAAPTAILARVKNTTKLTIGPEGDEVVSSTQASMSITEDDIPVGSMARADDGEWRPVIAENRHIGGFAGSPDYYSIDLV
ncbi:hypothetical protein ACPXB3_21540 [Gordonia sp. DT219]|uniref:hypothetical protein n=1 Tax=Gordonia sp. DT219 TaxID=3416658 RepID=UPI003CEA7111